MKNSNTIISEETVTNVKISPKAKFSIKDIGKYGAVIQTLAKFKDIDNGIVEIEAILESSFEKLEREYLSEFLGWENTDDGRIKDLVFSISDDFRMSTREDGSTGMGVYDVEKALYYLADKYSKYITIETEQITIYEDDIDMDASKYPGVGWVEKMGRWIALKPTKEDPTAVA